MLAVRARQVNSRPLSDKISFLCLGNGYSRQNGGLGVPDEPEETLGSSVLLGLEFVAAEVLDVVALDGRGELTVADFLRDGIVRCRFFRYNARVHLESCTLMLPSMSFLTGEKATEPRASTRRERELAI